MQNQQASMAFDSINPAEIAKAATLFDNLKQLRLKLKSADESVLERAFEIHVQGVLDKLDARLQQHPNPQQQLVEIILARHGLYDAAFQQVVLLCQAISPALGEGIKDLRAAHSGFLSDFQHVVKGMVEENNQLLEEVNLRGNHIAEMENNVLKLDQTLRHLNEEAEEQNKKILDLRQHLRITTQELNRLREGAVPTTTLKRPPFDSSVTIGSRAKSPGPTLYAEPVSSPRGTLRRTGSSNSFNNMSVAGTLRSDSGTLKSSVALNTPTRGPLALTSPVNWLQNFREDVQRALDEKRCRSMTLNECKEAIERIYESKVIANDKASQGIGNIPMETMEQHVYRNYEKKYGLRTLAVEHAGTLLRAVEEYAVEDSDVCIFEKIFRNEIEEDFRLVQKELVSSIRDLTMVQLMGRYPTKDTTMINALLEQKMHSGFVYEDEWRDMVNYLYNANDSATLCLLLKKQAQLIRERENETPAFSASSVQFSGTNNTVNSPFNSTNSSSNNNGNSAMLSPTSPVILNKTSLTTKISGAVRVPVVPNSPDSASQPGASRSVLSASFVVGVPSTARHSSDSVGSGVIGYNKGKVKDVKRLGYASPTLTISAKDPSLRSRKDMLSLPFPLFVKIIQDFQLRTHQEYLSTCLQLFRDCDRDVDGVLNAAEFREFYNLLRRAVPGLGRHETEEDELRDLLSMMKQLDPHETDRFIFSGAVACLQQRPAQPQQQQQNQR